MAEFGRAAAIELRQISKNYGFVPIINELSLAIAAQEFVVLLGPSGCGKSTLLRMIAGLEEVSGGELLFDGVRGNETPARERDFAMVFQNYALYPHMSVADNMGFALRLRGTSRAATKAKVAAVAEQLGLTSLLARKPKELSGGQRQRVAMGRAIVRQPKAFLFDEPLSNLDAELRTKMRVEIKQLHRQLRSTMVYVTHDQVEAMTLADRLVVMRGGKIQQVGKPIDVFNHPKNLFVASFIGSPPMNRLPGVLDNGQLWLQGLAHGVPLPGLVHVSGKQTVTLGIRPQHFYRRPGGAPVSGLCLPAVVNLVEPLGTDMLVHATWQGLNLSFQGRFDASIHVGHLLEIAAEPTNLHIFDAVTGDNLSINLH